MILLMHIVQIFTIYFSTWLRLKLNTTTPPTTTPPPGTFRPLLDKLGSRNLAHILTRPTRHRNRTHSHPNPPPLSLSLGRKLKTKRFKCRTILNLKRNHEHELLDTIYTRHSFPSHSFQLMKRVDNLINLRFIS